MAIIRTPPRSSAVKKSAKPKSKHGELQHAFNAWIYAFKKAGEADVDDVNERYATLEAYEEWLAEAMDQICVISTGVRVINITGEVAAAVISYLKIDGRDDAVLKFLEQQRYVKSGEACPKYVFIFDLGDEFNGCAILRGDDFTLIDLADLNGHPFDRLQICGFLALHVAHADRSLLDLDVLQKEIEDDLLFDYDEDEIEINFFPNDDQTVLSVTVHKRRL